MTICLAAIGSEEKSEVIVFATDHMLSQTNLGQFEHAINKYKVLSGKLVVMFSGQTVFFPEILAKLQTKQEDFDETAKMIFEAMNVLRQEKIQNEILNVYGVAWDFVVHNLDKQFQNPVIDGMMKTIGQASLRSQILLVGFKDKEARLAQITEITNEDLGDITFAAIGSGSVQALNTLLFQRHSKEDDLAKTIYDVYKAKRNAEVSVGAGKNTGLGTLVVAFFMDVARPHQLAAMAYGSHWLLSISS